MPSPFTHVRRHSASAITSISSTFTQFCLSPTSRSSGRAFSVSIPKHSVALATKAISRSPSPMKVVKRQIRAVTARTYSYSGMFFTSFLLASFLPFQLAPTGGKGAGSGSRGKGKGRQGESGRGKEGRDPDRHDMDNKSMASDGAAKNKQHRSSTSTAESKPQIHANHRSGSSLRSSTHGASYRPRRNGGSTLGGAGQGAPMRGAAGRASAKKQRSGRMALRRQGWR